MSEPPELIEVLQQWMAKAEGDYAVAEHTLQMKPEDCPFDMICFHCQQVVEKYLKTLQVFLGIDPPRTHKVDILLDLLPEESRPVLTEREQETLSDYAVINRYPGSPLLGSAEANEALRLARQVRDFVRSKLPPKALLDLRRKT
jgi:HEPN domain-containing protein